MSLLLNHISNLYQAREVTASPLRGGDMDTVPHHTDMWIYIKDGIIEDLGSMDQKHHHAADEIVDCSGMSIMPGYVDSHTHLIFAAPRAEEFVQRIEGRSYQEVADAGGGILNSAKKLQALSEDQLYHDALKRLKKLQRQGTTTIEVKSGYGLTTEAEIKMLRVARRLGKETGMAMRTTFLGAHALPKEFSNDRNRYIDKIVHEMIPQVAAENLADYVDVFCEDKYFTVTEMDRILKTAADHRLRPKVHVNQFTSLGAIAAAVDHYAVSVDHLEVMEEADFLALQNSQTIATLLPSCSFFLGLDYAPAKELLSRGAAIALASDYNPGSTPSGNMGFVFALACIKMKLTPQQAFNALTLNAAHALNLAHKVGSITPGKRADLLFYDGLGGLEEIPYFFGDQQIDRVMIGGQFIS